MGSLGSVLDLFSSAHCQAVSRAFGDGDIGTYVRAEPHITVVIICLTFFFFSSFFSIHEQTEITPDVEFLVLCCDGLTDVADDKKIIGDVLLSLSCPASSSHVK